MAGVNVATSTRVCPIISDKVVGSGGTQTASFMYLQQKKSNGVKSGEQGGQVIGLFVLISFPPETFNPKSPKLHCENVEVLYRGGIACH